MTDGGVTANRATEKDDIAPDQGVGEGDGHAPLAPRGLGDWNAAVPISAKRFRLTAAFGALLLCEMLADILHVVLKPPLPSPLIGVVILMVMLSVRPRSKRPKAAALEIVAAGLIDHIGLFLVPAGVGVIVEISVLRNAWSPLLAGLIVSTVLGLAVTGMVMQHLLATSQRRQLAEAAGQ